MNDIHAGDEPKKIRAYTEKDENLDMGEHA
jgi:hypothetical protein